jgi:transposase
VGIEDLRNSLSVLRHQKESSAGVVQAYLSSQHEQISQWREMPYMTVTQMVRLFQEQGQRISETSLRRYLAKHFPTLPSATVHLETVPGRQAQGDFFYAGMMMDPLTQKVRKAYGFIMTLSHSRHRFVRFVFRQDVETWIDCHIRAFHFFGGVPETIMLDNLKAGVVKADIYDPLFNRSYGELERHYGFVCDPNKVRTAQHKGKVERSVTIVRQQVLAGRSFKDSEEANTAALTWCRHEIATKVTRTTGRTPWDLFEKEEKACLKPLPATDYECALWQHLKVHRDHHVVFEGSYYSVPTQYIGQIVWLRASKRMVEIYLEHQKIKTHVRAKTRGQWVTDPQDYPQSKQEFLLKDKEVCLKQAQDIGPFTVQFLDRLLKVPTMLGQRKAQAILRLASYYGEARLEAACQRFLSFDNYAYRSVKKILAHGYHEERGIPIQPPILDHQTSYLRPVHELVPVQGGSIQ